MQPDDRLEQQLSAAGDRARDTAAPDRAFATSLRDRLMSQYPAPAADRGADRGEEQQPRRRWPFALPRQLRLAPLALAAVLGIATVAGAGQLYVALTSPDATPTPLPSPVATTSASLEPTPESTARPTPEPTAEPTPSVTPAPTPEPTAVPTAKPTPQPTPQPTPIPIGSLNLAAVGCNGGVVLGWSIYDDPRFNHYLTLRSTSASIPLAYPPQGGAVDPGGTYGEWLEKTSAVDPGASVGVTSWYRTMAFDADDRVIAASDVVSAVAKPVKALGALSVGPAAVEGTQLTWTPYGGLPDCFSYYKVVYSETNPSPSYGTDPYLAVVEGQATSSVVVASGADGLLSGHIYYLRVQAVRSTALGWIVTAQTDVTTYAVP